MALKTNGQLNVFGATVSATGATLSAGGKAQVSATAGAVKLNNAIVLAGDTATVTGVGIAAGNAAIGAVNSVTLDAGTGDFSAPSVLVQSQNGGINLNAANVDVAGSAQAGAAASTGLLAAQTIAITAAGAVDLSRTAAGAGTDIMIAAQGAVRNDAGRIIAGGRIDIAGASLSNRGGVIDANSAIDIDVADGAVVNDGGRISTRDVLTMSAAGGPLASLSNAGGVIETTGALNAQLLNFNNEGGRVVALAGLTLSGGPVNNAKGLLASNGNVSVDTLGGAYTGDNGQVLSTQGDVALAVGTATLNNAGVRAQRNVTISATQLTAAGAAFQANTGSLQIDVDGAAALNGAQLLAGQDIALTAGDTALNGATLAGGGNVTLATGALQASQAQISSRGNFSAAANAAVTADGVTIAAGGSATIAATQGIAVNLGSVSAQVIGLDAGAGALNNASGRIIASALTGTALTLHGQGMANDGGVIASNADLSVNAGAGNLGNAAGTILAVGAADIRSTGLGNVAGTIAANGNLVIDAAQADANAATDSTGGTIQSGQAITLTAGATTLTNAVVTSGGDTTLTTGALQASQAKINVQGNLSATSSGAVTADRLALAATGRAAITAAQGIDLSAGNVSAKTIGLTAGGALNNAGGNLIASAVSGTAMTLQSQGLSNAGGTIASAADLAIDAGAGSIDNTAGKILAIGAAGLRSTGLSNRDGTIAANGNLGINAAQAHANAATDGTGGTIQSGQAITFIAGVTTLDNAALTSGGNTTLSTGSLQARQANINVQGNFNATSTGAVAADRVALAAGGSAAIAAAQGIDVSRGTVTAGTALTLTSNGLENDQGTIAAGTDLSINAGTGSVVNTGGSLLAVAAADVRSTGLDNRAGLIASNGSLTLNTVQAHANAATDSTDGTIQSGQGITLTAGATTLANATVTSGGNATFATGDLRASQARINVQGNFSATSSGGVTAGRLALAAGGAATILAAQGIDVNHANVNAQTIDLNAGGGVLNNSAGTLAASAATGVALTLQSNGLLNDQGLIASAADLSINAGAGSAANAAGSILAVGAADIRSTGLNNRSGLIAANGNLAINAAQANANSATDGTDGTLQSGQNFTFTAGATNLSNATVTSGGNTTFNTGALQASQARVNVQGSFNATSSGAVTADRIALAAASGASITAAQGIAVNHAVVSAQTINLSAGSGVLNNDAGSLVATAATGTALTLQGNGLSNDAGTIASGAGLSINATTGSIRNTAGSIQAVGAADILSTGLDNRTGTIASNGDLTVNAALANASAATDSTDGAILSAQSITLTAGATTLTRASIASGGNTALTTGALEAGEARINVQGNFSANAAGAVTAAQASIAAGGGASITATQGIDVNHASVSAQTINLNAGGGALNNAAGNLVAVATVGTALTLQSQGLTNDGGSISSAAGLGVNAGAASLSNVEGSVIAAGAADVRSTGLNNVDGTIAANGALVVNAAQANAANRTDNTRGVIRSAQSSLTLTTGQLINSRVDSTDAGSVINAAADVTVNATGPVDNSRSEISAGNDVRIAATGAVNNQDARIVAGRDVAVGGSAVVNTSGLIAGNRNAAVTAGAGGVTNTNGVIQGANNLAITSTGAVNNNSGSLMAGNQLDLTGGALSNSQGLISSQAGNTAVTVTSYTNTGGSVVAGGSLSLDTQGGSLTANGSTFSSGANMTLRAGATQLNDASITAGGSLDARTASLQALRADVQAAGDLVFNAGSGAFNAADSNWQAGQSLALSGGAMTLTDATVSANTSVAVTGTSVNATRASITSPGDVSVVATNGALNIGDATLLAGRDLTATGTGAGTTSGAQVLAGRDLTLGNGANFDFSAVDLQYQFGRDLTVHAQGISTAGQQVSARNLTLDAGNGLLNNQGGTLQATGNVSASGHGLNNQGGTIAAAGQVSAGAGSGTLNNAGGQIFSTEGSTSLAGATIDNTSGTVSAAQDVAISGGTLNNAGNTIVAGRNLSANLSGALNNSGGGRLIANTGSATITANGINNQSGTISGATSITANAGSGTLSNTGGLVTGSNVFIGGAVNNSVGVISGSNSVSMTTRALNNDAGVIESGAGGIAINTQGHTLTNTNSGSMRGIVSQGSITIAAGDINNQAGYIGANGGLNITQSSSINNQGGTLLGLGNSSVTTSGTLNNQGGSILSGADLAVSAGTLNNSNAGTIYAARDLTVTAGTVDNSNTKNASYPTGLLAGRNATITAGTINNTNGAIVALGDATVRATSSLNNTQGQIAGNSVTIATPVLTNTGGRVDAQQSLTLQVPQFSADGVLASNGAMNLELQGNYTNSGTVSANGDLSITTTGSYTNQGRVSAQNSLSLSASGIDNQAGATIDSRATTLTTSGTVNNAGLINSTAGQTSITAGTVNNTGRIYGDSVAITGTVNNSIGAGGSAVIASRGGDVTINGQLNNTDGAQVFSLGSIQINGSVRNDGSTINAMQNVGITGSLTNTNTGFTTGIQTRSEPANAVYITPSGSTTRYNVNELGWRGDSGGLYVLPSITYPIAVYGGSPIPLGTQQSCTGGEDSTCTPYFIYSNSDAVWAKFGVASPANLTAPSLPAGEGSCTTFTGGESGTFEPIMTGACGTYWADMSTYNAAVATRQGQLDAAIYAFNADVETRVVIDWYETTITGKTITETSVTSSNPAYVLAGGNISIGSGTNTDSVIVAGGNVSFGGSNLASDGTRETVTTGTMVFSHRTWSGGFSQSYDREVSAPQPIAEAPVTETFDLPILQFQGSGSPAAPAAGGTSTPVGGASAAVPGIGASVGSARNADPAGAATGITQNGTPTAGGGGAVQVGTTTTGQPQSGSGVSGTPVTGGGTVTAGSGTGPDAGNTNVTAGTGNTPTGAGTVTAGTGNTPTGSGLVAGPGNGPTGGSTVTTTPGTGPAAGTTVGAEAGTSPTDVTPTAITASLSGAPEAALPGSVIAGGVRAGQLAAITTSLTNFSNAAKALPTTAAAADTSSRQVAPVAVKAAGYTTVRAAGGVRAPNSQLFTLNRSPTGPLVETDPAFTGYRTWLSSAYMLTQLSIDPERNLKLYGDGFAEQRLIDDQILALTGRRFLGGYSSTEDEYQALLDAGVMYARQYQLTPGVALSAEQMALLTTDIVWLEARSVNLPDGSTVQALVPTVYLRRPIAGDLAPTGALIAGSNVTLRNQGDLVNTGTIIANGDASADGGKLTIDGQNVSNSGTLRGNVISVTAQQTIDNTGGVIEGLGAGSSVSLNARDIILRTTTQTSTASIVGPNGTSIGTRTNVDRIATVSADSVTLAALNNISLKGATVAAAGTLAVTAGGSVTSDAVQTGYALHVPMGGGGSQGRSSYYDVASTAQQLTNLSGNNVVIAATGDATFKGTNATAVNNLNISAASINIEAAKDSLAIAQQGVNKKGYEMVGKSDEALAGGVFKAGNNVSLIAAQDITVTGANVLADKGQASLIAGSNVIIQNAITEHSTQAQSYDSNKRLLSTHTKTAESVSEFSRVEGSVVGGNTVLIDAGRDATVQASQVNAVTGLVVRAGNDVNILTAQQLAESSSSRTDVKTASGLAVGLAIALTPAVGHLGVAIANSSQSANQGSSQSSTAVGSTLTGANVVIQSGRDTTVQGSTVIADQDLAVIAGRNLTIVSAQDTVQGEASSSSKKSGSIGTTLRPAIGVVKQSQASEDSSTTQVASTIASLGGNVSLKAGEQYTQTASNVMALQGDVAIAAKNVTINEAQDTQTGATQSQYSKTAVGGAISVPLLDAARSVGQMADAAGETGNTRVQALAAATAAMAAKSAIDSASQLASGGVGFEVSVSLGSSKNESQSTTAGSTAVGSSITGNNVAIVATGAGAGSNVSVIGSNITAANNATVIADGKITLQAAASTFEQHSTNSSSGWSVGVGFAMGTNQNGFTLEASANKGKGNADGSDTTYTNSLLTAGNTVTIQSGGDTTLKGAVVAGQTVKADVGGNLNIESLQDTSKFDSKQTNAGVGVSLCIPPFCYGASTVSANVGKAQVEGNFASVTEQSGIKAGDGGFQVNVAGNTDLKGGVISSTDKAIADVRNTLTTATLTQSDIQNRDVYDANSYSLGVSFSGKVGDQSTAVKPADVAAAKADTKPGGSAGIGSASGSQGSTTASGISAGVLTITDGTKQQELTGKSAADTVAAINRDVTTGQETSGVIAKAWNGAQLMADVQAQAQITAAFGSAAAKQVGDFAEQKRMEALASNNPTEAAKWAEGGEYRVALHAGVGVLAGGLPGATGAATTAALMPAIGKAIDDMNLPDPVKQALGAVAAGAIGVVVGGTAGGVTAGNTDLNNRQLHPTEEQWLKDKAKLFAIQEGITEADAMKRLTQQALKDVDYLWRAQLSDGDDQKAESFLKTNRQTFTNNLGEQQQLFTAAGQQLLRPEMFADTANPGFYKLFGHSGISRNLNDGLLKEFKDSGINVAGSAMDLAQKLKDNPGLVASAAWEAVKNLPQGVVDSFKETGTAIGEGSAVALSPELTAKLNAVYGTDTAGAQKAILALRITAAVTGAAGAAKTATSLTDSAAAAISAKLDAALDQKALNALLKSGGAYDKSGTALLDLKQLTTEQKGVMGDVMGAHTVKQIVPDGQKIARIPGNGEKGIDDLYKVNRPDVDYVNIEYKFVGDPKRTGSSALGSTADGKQGSASWIAGSDRIESAVGSEIEASKIYDALRNNRVESWVVTTYPDGSTAVQVLDSLGNVKSVDTSKILPNQNLSGARP